jgi:N,N-dimethylformamidase beta subunit-like, C-terminal
MPPLMAWGASGRSAERPSADPARLEAWCYTDRFSYRPSDRVDVHVHTTAAEYSLTVIRDGSDPEVVWSRRDLPGVACDTPSDAYAVGCGWPVACSLEIDPRWRSGFYLLVIRVQRGVEVWEREHFFVVRAGHPDQDTPLVLVLTTSTLLSYNDWGGANGYWGLGPDVRTDDVGSRFQAVLRPIGRGMLRKPVGAPRKGHPGSPPAFWIPRYEDYEWARYNGYSLHHASTFWATYERPFCIWAERHGYRLDYLTQHDLHHEPGVLAPYRCAVIVGHDEYWSWQMRDEVDRFVDDGGNVARFGGNFGHQVRLEQGGAIQIARWGPRDPLWGTERQHLSAALWELPGIGRPGAQTMGLNGLGGIYTHYGVACPRSSGGYTVYRPRHWTLEGTDLYYGDLLGGPPAYIASYEVDGVNYTFRKGLPYPTFDDGAPASLEIIGMCPAVAYEEDRFQGSVPLGDPPGSLSGLPDLPEGLRSEHDAGGRRPRYGSGMMASFTRGAGTVFNAGASQWVAGLVHQDWFVERITRNVLDRFSR